MAREQELLKRRKMAGRASTIRSNYDLLGEASTTAGGDLLGS